jgi:hypothetical protein
MHEPPLNDLAGAVIFVWLVCCVIAAAVLIKVMT